MLDLLFDWDAVLAYGTDVAVYLIMALIGTTFFVLRLLLALFLGGDGDIDAGMEAAAATDAIGREAPGAPWLCATESSIDTRGILATLLRAPRFGGTGASRLCSFPPLRIVFKSSSSSSLDHG